MSEKTVIRFCGFGGQGIILSSVVFGTAAVEYGNKYGVQTQSYGSEARGGECESELILSNEQINSPIADKADILVAMSQQAYNKYIDTLKIGGLLIIDPDMVTTLNERKDVDLTKVPATKTAFEKIKSKITANMIMLGFLQNFTGLISEESLKHVIQDLVSEKFLEVDLKAVDEGIKISKNIKR
ncbi:MAG: 2-oxoacid:acceptor oxidoreductase family protein [Methanomicrobia archaeon]|nr:2-oxoacid:acceptor oxidoreductase family protein [Methanomicrobia archaeon]